MKFDKDMVDKFFTAVDDALDKAYHEAYAALDDGITKLDLALDDVKRLVYTGLNLDDDSRAEPVRVKPDPAQMCHDLGKYNEVRYNMKQPSGWHKLAERENCGNITDVEKVWDELPEEYKSWVGSNPNAPW